MVYNPESQEIHVFFIKNVFQKNIILKKMDLYKNPRPHIYVENINGNTDKIWRGVSATNLIKEKWK